jgi:hypothetical protein
MRKQVVTAAEAYSKAIRPTPTLIQGLIDAVAQDLADALGGPVAVTLPGNIRIVRNPAAVKAA